MSKKSLEVGNVVVVGAAGSVKRGVVAFIGETQVSATPDRETFAYVKLI